MSERIPMRLKYIQKVESQKAPKSQESSQESSQPSEEKCTAFLYCKITIWVRGLAKSALTLGLEAFKIAWVRFLRLEAIYFNFKYKHKL